MVARGSGVEIPPEEIPYPEGIAQATVLEASHHHPDGIDGISRTDALRRARRMRS